MTVASAMYNKDHLQTLHLNGNQFGTEWRNQIREILAESGREECLDDLDEDDSDGEGEEEEDYEDNGEEETDEDEIDDDDAAYLSTFDKTNGNVTNLSLNSTKNIFSFRAV